MTETISRIDQVPVMRDGVVRVANCGASGLFAALSAARECVGVFVVNRLYLPGGNSGPGMLVGAFVDRERHTGKVAGLEKDRTHGGLARWMSG